MQQAAIMVVKQIPKVLSGNIVKQHLSRNSYKAIAATSNIPVSTSDSIICRFIESLLIIC